MKENALYVFKKVLIKNTLEHLFLYFRNGFCIYR